MMVFTIKINTINKLMSTFLNLSFYFIEIQDIVYFFYYILQVLWVP